MSQWTHILGVVRFDSMAKNVWPEPRNKDEIVKHEADFVHDFFQRTNIPSGSEGPIEVETVITNRGPTVLLTGDLRDFGAEDLNSIVDWLNQLKGEINKSFQNEKMMLFIRDAVINCNVEFDNRTYIITEDEKSAKFILQAF
jgi:hypothetical protein